MRALEERLDVASGDLGEVVAQLVGVQFTGGATARSSEQLSARSGTGLEHLGAGEDVAHGDDLRGVLGVDHLSAAWHGEHVVRQQWAQREERGAATGGGHHAAVGQADQRVVRQDAPMGVELLARLQGHRVHPPLGVGQLHPVTGLERPPPHGGRLHLLLGEVAGRVGGVGDGHVFIFR